MGVNELTSAAVNLSKSLTFLEKKDGGLGTAPLIGDIALGILHFLPLVRSISAPEGTDTIFSAPALGSKKGAAPEISTKSAMI